MDIKTKIIATIGPACDNKTTLKAMLDAGVNAFRLNMSHGDDATKRKLYRIYGWYGNRYLYKART